MPTMAPSSGNPANAGTAPAAVVPFDIASRTQARLVADLTIVNTSGAGAFPVVPLPASGFIRRLSMLFRQTVTYASGGAVGANIDGPWNLVDSVYISDSTGQPIIQPLTGYNLYLINKYLTPVDYPQGQDPEATNPIQSPEFVYSATATTGTATFRLDLVFEISPIGYGSIPNLDSNAALQLNIRYQPYTNAFAVGVTPVASLNVRITQWYYAPVPSELNGAALQTAVPGVGDYREVRYETQTVSASAENLVNFSNRGGLIQGFCLVSRAAGVRTALGAFNPFGISLDNQEILSGVFLSEWLDWHRRQTGNVGTDLTGPYTPPATPGVRVGLDVGVIPVRFDMLGRGRNMYLPTKAGSLLQARFTPGAGATQLEIVTGIVQVRNFDAFYAQ